MTLFLSSSSTLASAALFSEEGVLLAATEKEVPMAASGALVEMTSELLDQLSAKIADVRLFGAEIGPGSFTGTRVAVTLAKTYAFVAGGQCIGFSSFDLIDAEGTVAFPSKKGEYFVRYPGRDPYRTTERPEGPLKGFGPWFEVEVRPRAANASSLLATAQQMAPQALVPIYWIEPSISVPKKRMGGHVG